MAQLNLRAEKRLGQPLTGFDTPTLRGLFGSAPYLHDGSAATLEDAVTAHAGVTISPSDLTLLVSFLQQIDGQEPAANTPPSLVNPGDQSTTVNNFVTLTLASTDPDIGDTMLFSATGLPDGLSIDGSNGIISGIPTITGPYAVTATVSDAQGTSTSVAFSWTVLAEVNEPPVLTSPGDQFGQEGDIVSLSITANDPDANPLTFSATGLPVDLSIDSISGLISGTLSFTSAGSHNVTVTVTDGIDTDTVSFQWTVTDVNQPPVLTSPGDQTNQEGDNVNLLVIASDPDGDLVTFSATGLPNGLDIDSSSGLISGTLSTVSDGLHNVTLTVSAGTHTVSETFLWTVFNVNQPPVLTSPGDQSNNEGDTVNLTVIATDPDGDPLTFLATGLPPGLSMDSASGLISGTLSPLSSGSYNITVTVLDSTDTVSASFLWSVTEVTILVNANFDTDAEGFTYNDDTFRGTSEPTYASGTWSSTAGLTGGGLQVLLGGIDDNDIFGMSGGWRYDFNIDVTAQTTLSFQYKLTQASEFEDDEFSQALVSVDGALLGQDGPDYLAQITGDGNGGPNQSTDWRFFTVDLGTLAVGSHTLVIGGYNNKKTLADETTEILVDDVIISQETMNQPPTLTNPGDQSNSEGESINLNIHAIDADGDPLTFDATGLPPGLSINRLTGLISGTSAIYERRIAYNNGDSHRRNTHG